MKQSCLKWMNSDDKAASRWSQCEIPKKYRYLPINSFLWLDVPLPLSMRAT